jgi:hypothetical protein
MSEDKSAGKQLRYVIGYSSHFRVSHLKMALHELSLGAYSIYWTVSALSSALAELMGGRLLASCLVVENG